MIGPSQALRDELSEGYALALSHKDDINVDPKKSNLSWPTQLCDPAPVLAPAPGWFEERRLSTLAAAFVVDETNDEQQLPPWVDVPQGPQGALKTLRKDRKEFSTEQTIVRRALLAAARSRGLDTMRRVISAGGARWRDVLGRRAQVLEKKEPVEPREKKGSTLKKSKAEQAKRKAMLVVEQGKRNALLAAARALEEEGSESSSESDEAPGAVQTTKNLAEWLVTSRKSQTTEATDAEEYLLYVGGGSGSLPAFFPGDRVIIFHKYGPAPRAALETRRVAAARGPRRSRRVAVARGPRRSRRVAVARGRTSAVA